MRLTKGESKAGTTAVAGDTAMVATALAPPGGEVVPIGGAAAGVPTLKPETLVTDTLGLVILGEDGVIAGIVASVRRGSAATGLLKGDGAFGGLTICGLGTSSCAVVIGRAAVISVPAVTEVALFDETAGGGAFRLGDGTGTGAGRGIAAGPAATIAGLTIIGLNRVVGGAGPPLALRGLRNRNVILSLSPIA